jgi:leucyl-tRNA synthetase
MMVLVNELYKVETLPRVVWETLVKMLSPYVPHLAEELWEKAGHEPSLANVAWPSYDEELTIDSEVEMVFQINGKVRAKEVVEKGLAKEDLLAMAKANEKIVSWLEGKTIVKEIVVPDKLVNIVVR